MSSLFQFSYTEDLGEIPVGSLLPTAAPYHKWRRKNRDYLLVC